MGNFSENLDLRHTYVNGVYKWFILSELKYTSDSGVVYVIPVGFLTDLASIPRPLWPILAPFWRYAKASVLHDFLLEQGYDTVVAAKLFREAMISSKVNRTQVFVIYWAVRMYFTFKPFFLRLRDIYKACKSNFTKPKG